MPNEAFRLHSDLIQLLLFDTDDASNCKFTGRNYEKANKWPFDRILRVEIWIHLLFSFTLALFSLALLFCWRTRRFGPFVFARFPIFGLPEGVKSDADVAKLAWVYFPKHIQMK